jgi:hypothetical protein
MELFQSIELVEPIALTAGLNTVFEVTIACEIAYVHEIGKIDPD